MLTLKSMYMRTALEPKEIRERAKEALKGVQFDTFVGTGLSGLLPLHVLAEQFKVYALAVRKPNDSSHSNGPLEGTLGERWIFVDDFIATGHTFVRAYETIEQTIEQNVTTHGQKSECVGAFLYDNSPRWVPAEKIPTQSSSGRYRLQEVLGLTGE